MVEVGFEPLYDAPRASFAVRSVFFQVSIHHILGGWAFNAYWQIYIFYLTFWRLLYKRHINQSILERSLYKRTQRYGGMLSYGTLAWMTLYDNYRPLPVVQDDVESGLLISCGCHACDDLEPYQLRHNNFFYLYGLNSFSMQGYK